MKEWEYVGFYDKSKFSLSSDCKTMRVWRKPNDSDNSQYFASQFLNSTLVMFWESVGPKGAGKLVVYNGRINPK